MWTIDDPLDGYVEPIRLGFCTKPACECDDGEPRCWVCEAEWAAMLSDADTHPEHEDDSETDPWLDEVRDPLESDDELWARAAQLEETPDA